MPSIAALSTEPLLKYVGMINMISEEVGTKLPMILTGGNASYVSEDLVGDTSHVTIYNNFLIHFGLFEILNKKHEKIFMKNNRIRLMAIDAMFIALIGIFAFVPFLGFITLGPVSFTTIPILVFIGAYIFGWKRGLIYGIAFGLFSLFKALTVPGTFDYFFINPLISVLPRAVFGFVAGLLGGFIKSLPLEFSAWLIFCLYICCLLFTLFRSLECLASCILKHGQLSHQF